MTSSVSYFLGIQQKVNIVWVRHKPQAGKTWNIWYIDTDCTFRALQLDFGGNQILVFVVKNIFGCFVTGYLDN